MKESDGSGESIGYKPVSMLAVAALLAGVASSLALASQLLWSLPLVGVGVALAALADVGRPGAEKAGRLLALAGLALSIGFGAQAVTSSFAARWIAESRVRAVMHEWLDAIHDGSLAEAQSVVAADVIDRARPTRRHAHHDHAHDDHGDHGDHGDHEDHAGEAEGMLAVPAVAAIRRCGPTATRDIDCTGPDEKSDGSWDAVLRLSPCMDGGPVEVQLRLTPSVFREGKHRVERWLITKIDVVP